MNDILKKLRFEGSFSSIYPSIYLRVNPSNLLCCLFELQTRVRWV